ncbi:ADP-ribosylation factor GTPase-activating protein AGD12-like [Cucumis melo var. makuwa]|uniref:ADP-ribosylation factor GTPase-activating protein AGD12-like n=1 Tax=Cucumis melo var. makuwa TaxID=1194695 RepID=A0A5D3E649_CUCMM|nr:ADP-ribosylation factor GTPase-activating protein AGD12-like [Cucumis melo var. makuwa]TYK30785.1 ADP-ribosylation factor GTPase-activating protein AGD12-like [Cucumis melo var. makuwa]
MEAMLLSHGREALEVIPWKLEQMTTPSIEADGHFPGNFRRPESAKSRLKDLLLHIDTQLCADCGALDPKWNSSVEASSAAPRTTQPTAARKLHLPPHEQCNPPPQHAATTLHLPQHAATTQPAVAATQTRRRRIRLPFSIFFPVFLLFSS